MALVGHSKSSLCTALPASKFGNNGRPVVTEADPRNPAARPPDRGLGNATVDASALEKAAPFFQQYLSLGGLDRPAPQSNRRPAVINGIIKGAFLKLAFKTGLLISLIDVQKIAKNIAAITQDYT